MFVQLTDVAKVNLANLQGNKIQISRFSAGNFKSSLDDLTDIAYDVSKTFPITKLSGYSESFTTPPEAMMYRVETNTKCSIKVQIPEQSPYFKVNMIVFYASTPTIAEHPFMVCYSLKENPKFSTTINRFGTNYHFILQLDITDRDFFYDFTNMDSEVPNFEEIDFVYDLRKAESLVLDQFILKNHVNLEAGSRVFTINSEEEYFGVILDPLHNSGTDVIVTR